MENKINIAELLKDCPQGMELYSPIFGEVYLDKIIPHLAVRVTTDKKQGNFKEEFLYDGRYGMNGECMLFPSKGKTNWEGFVPPCKFKDGDVAISNNGRIHLIRDNSSSYCCLRGGYFDEKVTIFVKFDRLATEEEKQKLFDAIKANGYKWNPETKTLEKLIEPKFKVGDRVKSIFNRNQYIITELTDNYYTLTAVERNFKYTEHIIDDKNYELVKNKFDITTLVPFESRVLVREDKTDVWIPAFYGFFHQQDKCFYTTIRGTWSMCIPYNEDTKHLIGTTNDCDNFYKTWEK